MTDAEKELIEAALAMRDSYSHRNEDAERFKKAKEAVAWERMRGEYPEWEVEFVRRLKESQRAEKHYWELANQIDRAGISLTDLIKKHSKND